VSFGGELVFAACGILALVSAVMTVTLRNPLRAAVALLAHILSLAVLYLTLHAHLLAAIQLLVYAGAVVVLFIFVIMLIGPEAAQQQDDGKGLVIRSSAAALMGLVGVSIAFSVTTLSRPYVDLDQCAEGVAECNQFGGVRALGDAIYMGAAVPFELVSSLLLVAIIAAVAVARGHTPAEKKALVERRRAREAEGTTHS
jgi:NADH-quinone oxidoreductase subunit J